VFDSPVFISHLNDVECKENENVHFDCRVEPSKDATMKIGKLLLIVVVASAVAEWW
jgi:hypothetical protein